MNRDRENARLGYGRQEVTQVAKSREVGLSETGSKPILSATIQGSAEPAHQPDIAEDLPLNW